MVRFVVQTADAHLYKKVFLICPPTKTVAVAFHQIFGDGMVLDTSFFLVLNQQENNKV